MKQFRDISFAFLRTAIAVGLLFYLTNSGAINWPTLLGLTANWPITLLAFLLLLVSLIVQAQRLCVLLMPHGMYLSIYSAVKLTLMGTFFNSCLPGATGGDAIKIYYAF